MDDGPFAPLAEELGRIFREWLGELAPQLEDERPARRIRHAALALGGLAVVFTPAGSGVGRSARACGRPRRSQHTLLSTTSLGFESYLTEAKFYGLPVDQRPYETFGLMAMAGYSYTPASPGVFEEAVLGELADLHGGRAEASA